MNSVLLSQHQSPPPLLRKARARSRLYGFARVTRPHILGTPLSVFNKNLLSNPDNVSQNPRKSLILLPLLSEMESHVASQSISCDISCDERFPGVLSLHWSVTYLLGYPTTGTSASLGYPLSVFNKNCTLDAVSCHRHVMSQTCHVTDMSCHRVT